MNYDNGYVHDLESLSKPYKLTINDIQKEIRTLEELREMLLMFEQPVEIKLEKREFGKKR